MLPGEDMHYPPFCLRTRDDRAVPGPVALLLCTRSREARLRDEASTAENSGKESKHQCLNQGKQSENEKESESRRMMECTGMRK